MKTLEALGLAEDMDNGDDGESSAKMDVLKEIIKLAEEALGSKLQDKKSPPKPEGGNPFEKKEGGNPFEKKDDKPSDGSPVDSKDEEDDEDDVEKLKKKAMSFGR